MSHRITLRDWSHIIISTTFGTYHSFYPLLQSNLCTSCFLLSICFQTIWRISHESPTLDLDLYYDLITSILMKDKKKKHLLFLPLSELFTTEASHLRTLRVLDQVFFQKMRNLLTSDELSCIFPNLPQVYELHGRFLSQIVSVSGFRSRKTSIVPRTNSDVTTVSGF